MTNIPPLVETTAPFDPPQPRLGIIHLMAWTLGSAMILALHRALDQKDEVFAQARIPFQVMIALTAFAQGAAIGGLLIWLKRKLAGGAPFPVAPGHWLLVSGGVLITVQSIGYGLMIVWQHWQERESFSFDSYLWYFLAIHTCGTVLMLLSCLYCRHRRWRVAFAGMAVANLAQLILTVLSLVEVATENFGLGGAWLLNIGGYVNALNGLLIVGAVMGDWLKRARRDWLHWAGVATSLATVLFTWLWTLFYYWAMSS